MNENLLDLIQITNSLLDLVKDLPISLFDEFVPIYKNLQISLTQLKNCIDINIKQINIIYDNRHTINFKDLLFYFQDSVKKMEDINKKLYECQINIKVYITKLSRFDVSTEVIKDFEHNSQILFNGIIESDKKYVKHIRELFLVLKDTFKYSKDEMLVSKFQLFIDKFYDSNSKIYDEIGELIKFLDKTISIFTTLCTYIITGNRNECIKCVELYINSSDFYN